MRSSGIHPTTSTPAIVVELSSELDVLSWASTR
jgi:hypothetical protein